MGFGVWGFLLDRDQERSLERPVLCLQVRPLRVLRQSGSDIRQSGSDIRQSGPGIRQVGLDVRQTGFDIRQSGSDKTDVLLDRDQEGRLPRSDPRLQVRPLRVFRQSGSDHTQDSQGQI